MESWRIRTHFDFVTHCPHVIVDMAQQLLAQCGAPVLGMLRYARQQGLQIYAHTLDVLELAGVGQCFHNGRVKCKFLIDFDERHLFFQELLADETLLEGPQIKVLSESLA